MNTKDQEFVDSNQLSFAFRGDQFLPDHVHDNYIRCYSCHIKYIITELKHYAPGVLICKFCLPKLGDPNV